MTDFDLNVQVVSKKAAQEGTAPASWTVTGPVLTIILSCGGCNATEKCISANTRCTTFDALC